MAIFYGFGPVNEEVQKAVDEIEGPEVIEMRKNLDAVSIEMRQAIKQLNGRDRIKKEIECFRFIFEGSLIIFSVSYRKYNFGPELDAKYKALISFANNILLDNSPTDETMKQFDEMIDGNAFDDFHPGEDSEDYDLVNEAHNDAMSMYSSLSDWIFTLNELKEFDENN